MNAWQVIPLTIGLLSALCMWMLDWYLPRPYKHLLDTAAIILMLIAFVQSVDWGAIEFNMTRAYCHTHPWETVCKEGE